MKQLILCEKPSAALKIASSLADGKVKAYKESGVPFYNIQIKGKETVVCCTVGHLFNLAEKNKQGLKYPVFDVEWKESFKVKKKNAYAQKYFDVLKELSKDADTFIISTDLDQEGEVIGLNILRYIFNQEDGFRMRFSTLTKDELLESYENLSKHLDWGLAKAGETRHILDWIWGINMSRALTLAIKSAGAFKLMSSGRVQGPALNLIVKREKEIQSFKPVPFWLVNLISDEFIAEHIKGNIWDKKEAETIFENTKGKKAFVKKISKREFLQEPPHPFDLTSLQVEAYRTLHINPKETLSLAQDLYVNGFISYPRTSSQKLPSALNFKKILEKLKKNNNYEEICSELLNKTKLIPNEGNKSDPAHPCFTEEASITLNPHGELKFKELIKNTEWNFDNNFKNFYTFPKNIIKVLAFDGSNIVSSFITKIWKTPYNKKMLEIHCNNGIILKTTPNHQVYTITKNGFEYIQAKYLLENYYLGYLPQNNQSEELKNKIIITEEDFIKTYNVQQQKRIFDYFKNKKLFRIKPAEVQTIEKLRKLNILPICYGTQTSELFAKLIGFICGDGHLNYEISKIRESKYPSSQFVAEEIDLEKIKIDLKSISIITGAKPKILSNTDKVKNLRISVSILNRLLIALGSPLGDKILLDFSIPKWIIDGDKNIKRAFLSTYFGNESSQCRVHYKNKRDLKNISISIDKIVELKDSAFNFYKQIKSILENDFEISVSNITQKNRKKPRKKDGKLTCTTNLSINNNRENLIKFLLNIGFNYCDYKEKLGKKALAYLLLRNNLIYDRVNKKCLAKQLRKEGKKFSEISKIINVSASTIKGWINYYKSDKELHVSSELPNFENFNFSTSNETWIKINKIVEVDGPEYVYDIEVDKYHTFFVNGFLVHNCIHPTGEFAKTEGKGFRVYDLIVRRFLSTFGEPAKKQTNTLEIDVNNEIFSVSGTVTLDKGWQNYYGRYASSKDVELPKLKENEEVKVKEIKMEDKETQPPKRYNQASIIKELDKKTLGTKSTRAAIIDTLYQRNYIKDNSIQATDLGIKLIDTLEKYSEQIIDEKLTRHFEKEMEKIREGKKDEKEILEEAKKTLISIFEKFKENEEKIGKSLLESQRITEEEIRTIGQCPKCEKGNLKILYSPKTKSKFVGCSSYPDCKNIYSLPRNGLIKKLDDRCKECGFYQVLVIRAGKRPWKLCLTPNCKSKEAWSKPFSQKALPKNDEKSLEVKTTEKNLPKNDEKIPRKTKSKNLLEKDSSKNENKISTEKKTRKPRKKKE